MYTDELQRNLINWTVLHSGHVDRRGYIGLSEMADCDLVIYNRYFHGQHFAMDEHLKAKLGSELEVQLIERMRAMNIWSPGDEICLYDGLVQGHTDGIIGKQDLLEIKTVPHGDFIPAHSRLPAKVFFQVQGYLHFTKRRYAHIVYLDRSSGLVQVFGLRYHEDAGRKLELKLERLVAAVKDCRRPECSCGHCKSGGNGHE